jgi:molybdopterin converting factor small subunit
MDLLRGLAGRHGAEFQSLVFDDTGNVRPSILVAVNDEQVMPDAAVPLHLGDSVAILSPMSGG